MQRLRIVAINDVYTLENLPRFKTLVAQEYADLIYNGLWFSAFHQDLAAFVQSS